ncbi:MAG: FAD-dependent oxidoreductase [Gammaproteobacteria bacterium]|nr:FAD-dependent oxidoreductase [Gammaproteobacteria bacterium]
MNPTLSASMMSMGVPDSRIRPRNQMAQRTEEIRCDVLVMGGSTSALFAALHAARGGAITCLVEPTDWLGGQLTAGGVPAVDFAWREDAQGVNTKALHRERRHNHYEFHDWLQAIGNPGDCTVSRHCFLPSTLLTGPIAKAVAREKNLTVLHEAVPIGVETKVADGRAIISQVAVVRRTAKRGGRFAGYERPFSEAIEDWYSPRSSSYFHKHRCTLLPRKGREMLLVEASEFGDVLALAGAGYLVGEDLFEGSTEQAYRSRGQSFTATFNLSIAKDRDTPNTAGWAESRLRRTHRFNLGSYGWEGVWRYRRLKGCGAAKRGQLSVMNWRQGAVNNGNDYAGRHLFLSYAAAARTIDERRWSGGVDVDALLEAERLSQDFFHWFVSEAPDELRPLIRVDTESVQTRHGFYKFPYLRESRRCIGYGKFLLCAWDLSFHPEPTGFPFPDRLATSVYDYDFHLLDGCEEQVEQSAHHWRAHPKPFFLPLRALSSDSFANLIVAGKSMAQSFTVNAATRTHPSEVVSGTAAGVVAAYCAERGVDMHQLIDHMRFDEIQKRVSRYQPLRWKIDSEWFPRSDSGVMTTRYARQEDWDARWSDSLTAYHNRDFLYFPIPDRELEDFLDGRWLGQARLEEVVRGSQRFLKCSKKVGFEILAARRGLSAKVVAEADG